MVSADDGMRWDATGWQHVMWCARCVVLACHVMVCHVLRCMLSWSDAMHVIMPPTCDTRIVAVPRMQTSRVLLSAGSTTLSTLLAANNTVLQSPQLSHAWLTTGMPYLVTHAASMSWSIPVCHSQACSTGGDDNDMTGQADRIVRICTYADNSFACMGPYGTQHNITATRTAYHNHSDSTHASLSFLTRAACCPLSCLCH